VNERTYAREARQDFVVLGYDAQVRFSTKSVLITVAVSAVVAMLVWMVVLDQRSEPYSIDRALLTGWKLGLGTAEDPWVIAVQPPAALTQSLFQQISKKVGRSLVAPPHSALPLVMRKEHDDALQGVFGVTDIDRMARGTFSDTSRFEPVCIGHLVDDRSGSAGELFFLAVNSREFNDLRIEIQPDFPEHAGIGIYDAGSLTPILPIATTDKDFDRWWPIRLDEAVNCQAQVLVK
jgi:hypothetical protein